MMKKLKLPRCPKTKRSRYVLRKKKENFRGFRDFDFALYPKSKTRKSRKVLFYLNFWKLKIEKMT